VRRTIVAEGQFALIDELKGRALKQKGRTQAAMAGRDGKIAHLQPKRDGIDQPGTIGDFVEQEDSFALSIDPKRSIGP